VDEALFSAPGALKNSNDAMDLRLRKTVEADLEIFFVNQTDPEANFMAAFTPKNPRDKAAYMKRWTRLLQNDDINMQTILLGDEVVGCVVKFTMNGVAEITYAISKAHWGKGIATRAVQAFLEQETTRPLFGRVACDNVASRKVMERSRFKKTG